MGMKQMTTEKGECGCGGGGGETEEDRQRKNVDVAEIGVKQKKT